MTAGGEAKPGRPAAAPVARGWAAGRGGRARRSAEVRLAREVGARIRRRRGQRGWSQGQLGRALGRDHSTVSRWESGDRLPTLPALLAIGRVLGCGPAALLPGGCGCGRGGDGAGRGEEEA